MAIGRDKIVEVALELLDEVGLDALTTRLLAERLGVKQPALYWHFKHRRALLDAMNDAMMARFTSLALAPAQGTWQEYAFEMGRQFRLALLSRRDGARVHAGTPANPAHLERTLSIMTEAGMPMALALKLSLAIGRFTVGWVLEEQAEPPEMRDGDAPVGSLADQAITEFFAQGEAPIFEAGLRFLITGAALELPSLTSPPAESD